MLRISSFLILAFLIVASTSAQSLFSPSPGIFASLGAHEPHGYLQEHMALGVGLGYRVEGGLDLDLEVRRASWEVQEFDFGLEASYWELRPGVTYHHALGRLVTLRVRGLLNFRFHRQLSGGFDLGGVRVKSSRRDADLSVFLFGKLRISDWLTVHPGAGLYRLRTLEEQSDSDCLPVELPGEGLSACGISGFGSEVHSTGVQLALPIDLHRDGRHVVLSPTIRYALDATDYALEPVSSLNLRFNF